MGLDNSKNHSEVNHAKAQLSVCHELVVLIVRNLCGSKDICVCVCVCLCAGTCEHRLVLWGGIGMEERQTFALQYYTKEDSFISCGAEVETKPLQTSERAYHKADI